MKPAWLPILIGFTAGVLFVFCTTEARDSSRDGGPVGDAVAADADGAGGECCEAGPYTFTTLAEGTIMPSQPLSEPVVVGDYREVIVYVSPNSCGPQLAAVEFRSDAEGFFGSTGQVVPGRIRVDGAELRVRYTCGVNISDYRVVGVR